MARKYEKSQHFLRGPSLVKELVGHSSIKKNDTVLDIGAGSGVITDVLAGKAAHVIAVEPDKETFEKLSRNLADAKNVTLVNEDFLTMDLPASSYKVFSNIPFHLSAPIVRKLVESHDRPVAIYLIVQRQFARKLSMDQNSFTSMLGAQIAPFYEVRIRKPLRRHDFTPPPNVDTVLLELTKRKDVLINQNDERSYRTFISKCFEKPAYFNAQDLALLKRSRTPKPSELSMEDWLQLYR